ncbi:hypothetical protein [Thermomonas sp.]|uniref:hypothetical protein n=1 Tax=Thermomonas sp. TaxID=1971895 RepID=UPI002610FBC0|nr:hypothetical protein [Thermomonas sp.]
MRASVERGIDIGAAGAIVELRDQAEAAAVAVVAGVVQAHGLRDGLVALRHGGSKARCTGT